MIKRKQDTVLKVAEGGQLMDFLMAKMGGMARSSVKQLLGQRRVKVGNAIQTRHDFMLKAGDIVTVSSGRGNSQLTHPKLRIVYEDDDLIVVNKQPGLLTVAATPGSSETTAYSILRAYVKKQNARAGIYVVHRLDRETSGLLVFARSEELQHYMRQYWRELVTERTYIALTEGVLSPREGKITTWLTEDKRNAVVYSSPVDDGGDIAITNYKVLKTTTTPPHPSPQGRESGSRHFSSLEGRSGGVSYAHYDMRWLKPMDEEILDEVGKKYKTIVTAEDGMVAGGLGSAVLEWMADHGYTPRVIRLGVNDQFVEHGSTKELYHLLKLDKEGLCESLLQVPVK